MSKYEPLRTYLRSRKTETVPMSFAEIEKVLGFKLPKSQMYPAWWSNNPTNNVMTNEWLAAGYRTEQVDIEGRKLVFRRVGPPLVETPQAKEPPESETGHPIVGFLKGMITIAPGVDLTEPADPELGEVVWSDRPDKPDSGQT
jgi:hypothetical protein